MSVFAVHNLKKHFGPVKAVDGITFSVEKGEIFGFLGPNGAGKSTTIRCAMDFLRPTSGHIEILGKDAQADAPSLKTEIGYLSPDVHLYPHWTGAQHIAFIAALRGSKGNADHLVKRFQFDVKAKTQALSSGNRQKLGLILAFMMDPKLLILDEPTAALDPLMQNRVYEELKAFQQDGGTVFISSHNLSEVERICGRVAIIRHGKLATIEDIGGLQQKRIHLVTARFSHVPVTFLHGTKDVEVLHKDEVSISLRVRHDINPVLKELARYDVHDVEITHASLEDIFMQFYKK
jgi:ABC-2 type transport system ATP-binding protein